MTAAKRQKLVLVEWLDSHAGRGWQDVARLDTVATPLYCRSVGWLWSENKDCKVIVPHLAGEKNGEVMQGSGDLVIPAKAIVKMTVLRN
jgi:hypothetical protein